MLSSQTWTSSRTKVVGKVMVAFHDTSWGVLVRHVPFCAVVHLPNTCLFRSAGLRIGIHDIWLSHILCWISYQVTCYNPYLRSRFRSKSYWLSCKCVKIVIAVVRIHAWSFHQWYCSQNGTTLFVYLQRSQKFKPLIKKDSSFAIIIAMVIFQNTLLKIILEDTWNPCSSKTHLLSFSLREFIYSFHKVVIVVGI